MLKYQKYNNKTIMIISMNSIKVSRLLVFTYSIVVDKNFKIFQTFYKMVESK